MPTTNREEDKSNPRPLVTHPHRLAPSSRSCSALLFSMYSLPVPSEIVTLSKVTISVALLSFRLLPEPPPTHESHSSEFQLHSIVDKSRIQKAGSSALKKKVFETSRIGGILLVR